MTTPGHAHVAAVSEQGRAWLDARGLTPDPDGHVHGLRLTVRPHAERPGWDVHTAECSCLYWCADVPRYPAAPAHTAAELDARLRELHADHARQAAAGETR